MAVWTYGFEAGTNGNAVGTSDASPAFSGAGGCTYSTAHPAHGSLGMKITGGGGTARVVWASGSPTKILARTYAYFASAPGADSELIRIQNVAGTGLAVRGYINSAASGSQQLRLGTSGTTNEWTSTVSGGFPLGQIVRIELYGDAGTSSTTGQIRLAAYLGDSTTPITGADSGLLTGKNVAGTDAALGEIRFGANGNPAIDFYFDDIGVKTGVDAVWGAWPVTNTPPTVSLTGNQNLAASAPFTINVTASDSDGTISTYAATVDSTKSSTTQSLTGASTATITGTGPSSLGHVVTISETVTDNGSATATATTELRTPITGSTTGVPLALAANAFAPSGPVGTWTRQGSGTSDGGSIAVSDDTKYMESAAVSGTEQSVRFRLQPSALRSSSNLVLRLGTDGSGTGLANATIRLYEGTTLRQTWTQAITATATDYTFTLSSGTLSAISDWGNLSFEYAVTS